MKTINSFISHVNVATTEWTTCSRIRKGATQFKVHKLHGPLCYYGVSDLPRRYSSLSWYSLLNALLYALESENTKSLRSTE